jgi:hypothetical protein
MVNSVIRPTWTPETDAHRRLIAETVEAARAVQTAEARAALAAGKAGGVPLTYLVEQAGISRATAYRHLPKSTGEDT